MSELINVSARNRDFRWQLLTTVSALALFASVCGTSDAKAADDDSDHPTIWIELGGQLERVDGSEQQFVPPFVLATPRPTPEAVSPLNVGHTPRFSVGEEGKITFEPSGTDWVFSAAVRYGRSNANKHLRQQSYPTQPIIPPFNSSVAPKYQKVFQFIDAERHTSETHAVLDFQAGKDFGIGMFGTGSASQFNFGVRFAQFGSKSNTSFKSDPDAHPIFEYFGTIKALAGGIYHLNTATAAATRSFHGVGPSIGWNASVPIAGNPQGGQVAFDWGVNAAVLFGRQRAKVHHQTTAQYHKGKYYSQTRGSFRTTISRDTPPDQIRSRFVTVPNIGGFAGASFRYLDAKISLGYRADFFFGAMDGGIDVAKKENRGFYGPFATVSVGLGG